MAWVVECPPRSFVTEELINPLESPDCDPKEQLALQGLCGTILKAFRDTPKSSHVVEATALSSIAAKDRECYKKLMVAFANALSTAPRSLSSSVLLRTSSGSQELFSPWNLSTDPR